MNQRNISKISKSSFRAHKTVHELESMTYQSTQYMNNIKILHFQIITQGISANEPT